MARERVGREREGMHGCFCWCRWSLLWRRALCNCGCFGFSAGGTLSNLVWDFKAFLYVAVVGLASGVAARGESGVTELQDSESSGVSEGGADADSANVLRLRQRA